MAARRIRIEDVLAATRDEANGDTTGWVDARFDPVGSLARHATVVDFEAYLESEAVRTAKRDFADAAAEPAPLEYASFDPLLSDDLS